MSIATENKKPKSNMKKSMVMTGLLKPIAMIISYIYVRFVLGYLGIEKYGVWSTILTILSWIGIFDIGIGNGLRNKVAVLLSSGRKDECSKIISSSYAIITIIMGVASIFIIIITQFCNWNYIFGVKEINENLTQIVSLCILFIVVGLIMSICKSIYFAMQKAFIVSLIEVLIQSINLIGIIILKVFTNDNILFLALLYGLSTIIINFIFTIILFKKYKYLSFNFSKIDIKEGSMIAKLGAKFFVLQICALVLFSTDSIIISIMYGATNVTPYSNVNKLFTAIISVYVAFISPLWSGITEANAKKEYLKIVKTIKMINLFMIPFFILSIIVAIIFRWISFIWLGIEIDYSTYLIIFGCIYSILSIWCNTYASIVNGLEWMKVAMIVAILQAIINIPLSLLFAKVVNLGPSGVLLGTVLVMVIPAIVFPIKIIPWAHNNLKQVCSDEIKLESKKEEF